MVQSIVGSAIFMGVALGGHYLLLRWARAFWPKLGERRTMRRALLILAITFLVLGPGLRWMVILTQSHLASAIHTGVVTEMVLVAVAAIPMNLVRLISHLVSHLVSRMVRRAPNKRENEEQQAKKSPLSRRQILEGVSGFGFLAASGSMLGWGMVRGRHDFRVEELVVKIPGFPRVLDGYTIAQVSDIHVGVFVGEDELAHGLELVRKMKPDLLAATGDLVDFDPAYAPMMARALTNVGARDGVAAILGNHDYYAGARDVLQALRAAGIEPLVNSARRIRELDQGGFALLGVDDLWAPRRGGAGPILARAEQMVPNDLARILLSHQPLSVDLWPGKVALQLSGHTHGGQINPGVRPIEWFFPYVAGRYDVKGTVLYVNRGFGTAGPPSRVGSPPEVTKVILVSA